MTPSGAPASFQAGAELFDLILGAGFLLAEFALDGADLLAQVGAALAGGELAFHVLAQLLLEFGDLGLARHGVLHHPHALDHVGFFQQRLFARHVEAEVARQQVGQVAGVLDVGQDDARLLGDFRRKVEQRDGGLAQVVERRLRLLVVLRRVHGRQNLHLRAQEGLGLDVVLDRHAAQRLHEQDNRAVRLAHELEHLAGDADAEKVARAGLVFLLAALGDEADHLALRQGVVDELDGGGPADGQRHDRAGEHDHAADRQDGQRVGNLRLVGAFGAVGHGDDRRRDRLRLRRRVFGFAAGAVLVGLGGHGVREREISGAAGAGRSTAGRSSARPSRGRGPRWKAA